MPDYFERTRTVLRHLLGSRPPTEAPTPVVSVPVEENLAIADGRLAFINLDRAATDPTAWLDLFETAIDRNVPIGNAALDLLRAQSGRLTPETMLWGSMERSRLISLLRPRTGLSARLTEMQSCRVLAA